MLFRILWGNRPAVHATMEGSCRGGSVTAGYLPEGPRSSGISMIERTTLLFCCLSLLGPASRAQAPLPILDSLFHHGYTLLQTDPDRAATVFEQIVARDSANVTALRQLGSIYSGLGDRALALIAWQAAQRHLASDTIGLQIAYVLSSLGQHEEAARLFEDLSGSPNDWIRRRAIVAAMISDQLACQSRRPWWGTAQAYPYYDTRFENLVASLSVAVGRFIDSSATLSLYGTAGATWDTRSSGGAFPVLYADHFVLLGTGIRYRPFSDLTLDLQTGLTYDLIRRPDHSRFRGDLRLVAAYGRGIFPEAGYADSLAWTLHPLADLFGSAGWYTRYSNGIVLLQGRAGAEVASYRTAAASLFLRANVGWDTRGDFYNRVFEIGPALRVTPHRTWGFSLEVDVLRGFYWSRTAADSPYGSAYTSIRLFLVFERPLCF